MTFLAILITVYIIIKVLFFGYIISCVKRPKKEHKEILVNKFDIDIILGKTHIIGEKTSEHNFNIKFNHANSNS